MDSLLSFGPQVKPVFRLSPSLPMYWRVLLCETILGCIKGVISCVVLSVDILFVSCREGNDLTPKPGFHGLPK